MDHYRKTMKRYHEYNKKDHERTITCNFCDGLTDDDIVGQNETMWLVRNRVSYDFFEGLPTDGEHLMIVPKRHVCHIADFTDVEKLDMLSLVGAYEPRGYNVYARSLDNVNRSQPHQHTHLIKLATKKPRVVFYSRKPYILKHF